MTTWDERGWRELLALVRAAAEEVPLPTGRIEAVGGHLPSSRTVAQAWNLVANDVWATKLDEDMRAWAAREMDIYVQRLLRLSAPVPQHIDAAYCWCRPVQSGLVLVHRDERVPHDGMDRPSMADP